LKANIYHNWQNADLVEWSGTFPFQGQAKALAVGQNEGGRLEVFYIGLDDKLYHNWQTSPGNGWAGDHSLGGQAKALAVGQNEGGRLEVFYIGLDDKLYHNWQTSPGNGWAGEHTFGGRAKALAVGQNEDGRLEVFYIGLDDKLYHNWQTSPGNGWAGEHSFGGQAKALAVGQNEGGRLEVFYIGLDDKLYHNWQTSPGNGWAGEHTLDGRAKALAVGQNEDGRLEVFYIGLDDKLYHNWQTSPNNGWAGEHLLDCDDQLLVTGYRIFDPPTGIHINDHCFVRAADGTWHMFGIEAADPGYMGHTPGRFAHATAPQLISSSWRKQEPALIQAPGESVLWAPHVIRANGQYYMFYCSGHPSDDGTQYGISLATSLDLWKWARHPEPLFRDGYHARDPMVMELSQGLWVMYYCATDPPSFGNHVVAYRVSSDLRTWSQKKIAYRDERKGTIAGPTESPFVVRRGDYYYLLIGPRPYPTTTPLGFWPNWRDPGYDGTDIFRGRHWNSWTDLDYIGHVQAHAAEVVRDVNGDWYVSRAGIYRGGVYLLQLNWRDDLDSEETSLPIP
jgi:hypothetical protein